MSFAFSMNELNYWEFQCTHEFLEIYLSLDDFHSQMTQNIEARDKSDICAMCIFLIIFLISSKQKKIDTKIIM